MFHVKHLPLINGMKAPGVAMIYRIFVLNQKPLGEIAPDILCQVLKRVHFNTLCEQYDVDPDLIPAVQSHLNVIAAVGEISPYFIVSYRQEGVRPIVVHQWRVASDAGTDILGDLRKKDLPAVVVEHFSKVSTILGIELDDSQLQDMGLLLAYEIARWAGVKGQGLVLGLDGAWYRLNRYHAFIPLQREGKAL